MSERHRDFVGTLLSHPEAIEVAMGRVKPGHFPSGPEKRLYEVLIEKDQNDEHINAHTIADSLESKDWFEQAGGYRWLTSVADSSVAISHLISLAEILAEDHRQTRLKQALYDGQQRLDKGESIRDVCSNIEEQVEMIRSSTSGQQLPDISEGIEEFRRRLDAQLEGEPLGYQTPWENLNTALGGIEAGQLIVIGALQKTGKTAFASSLAHHWAVKKRVPTLFVSLEMPLYEMVGVMVKIHTGTDYTRLAHRLQYQSHGGMTEEQVKNLQKAEKAISEAPLYIDSESQTVEDIVDRARDFVHNRGVKIVFVDYLQLAATRTKGDWYEKVAHASQQLKLAVAKKCGVPVVALSQVTRDQQGGIKGLRHGQETEQALDKLIYLTRRKRYQGVDAEPEPDRAERVVIVSYNRQGPEAEEHLIFDKTSYSWEATDETQWS